MRMGLLKVALIAGCLVAFAGCTGEEEKQTSQPAEPAQETVAETAAKEGEEEGKTGTAPSEPGGEEKGDASEPELAVNEVRSEVRQLEEGMTEETVVADEEAASEKAEEILQPDVQIYEARNGNVTFNHKMHSGIIACMSCHKGTPPQKIQIDKDTAHDMCKGCHEEEGAGPTSCTGCHIKE